MTALRKAKTDPKIFYGIVSVDSQTGGCSLITPEGHKFEIADNERGRQLANHLWSSVKVYGRVHRKPRREVLQVNYFEPMHSPLSTDPISA